MRHGDIWRGVDLLAEKHGLSASRLAKLAGLDATAFNKSKRVSKDGRLRWPSTESLARALAAVGEEFSDFAALIDGKSIQALPVLLCSKHVSPKHFDADGYPQGEAWDRLNRSMLNLSEGAFVIEITDASLQPDFEPGDRLILSPEAQIRTGDQVMVMTEQGELAAYEMLRRTDARISLKSSASPSEQVSYDAKDIAWIARILWVSK
ncbi:MAG: helix-turn-helix transcriptional regulator [Henriciella sp.]|nr:helix-turn-helix transcriptional regulator [Henriciella sp.]